MLKHFEAINVQEPKDCGAPPAGALGILGSFNQEHGSPHLPAPSAQAQTSLECLSCSLGSSQDHALTLEANDLLIFPTSQVKVRLYTALASASRAYAACSRFSGLRS